MVTRESRVPVIIPSLEPDERLLGLLSELKEHGISPVVVVDDGSGESYRHFFDRAEKEYHAVVLVHKANQGKGRALKDAFLYCLDTWPGLAGCVTADSDGQHTVRSILKCREALLGHRTDLVLGVRNFEPGGAVGVPAKSRIGNRVTCRVFSWLYGIDISDTQTGLRGIPAAFMERLLEVRGERFEFETQMLIESGNAGLGIVEVPIDTVYDSKENHSTHFHPVLDSVRIYRLFGFNFGRFVLSSLSSCVLDLVLFGVFCTIFRYKTDSVGYIAAATVCARILSALYNYMVNYRFVFKSRRHHVNSAARYTLLAGLQMSCSAALTAFFFWLLPVRAEWAVKVPVDALLFFVSYVIQKKFVY